MATLYDIPVPKAQYYRAKDYAIMIYNIERKKYPEISDCEYDYKLKKLIQKRYKAEKDTKTLLEVLKELYEETKKKEG